MFNKLGRNDRIRLKFKDRLFHIEVSCVKFFVFFSTTTVSK